MKLTDAQRRALEVLNTAHNLGKPEVMTSSTSEAIVSEAGELVNAYVASGSAGVLERLGLACQAAGGHHWPRYFITDAGVELLAS